ncbi:peptidylprolyl isomerase [Sulfurimonas paralvinellae]|uniref:Peptidyl-prolyl cis-trans isomerase n=1 Tax=Sulfurimonas paralvinellae TaxID=317658 RepID=A0A7M1BA07_9BACT|nr:peptidylprolyl isomerase [Sulfurimonas paralvinellae]QOP46557.1 peptidyl-prolyl cis-trans isomerase [Sulfurimonas paralvinellae]
MYKIILALLLTAALEAKVYDGVAVVVEDKAITLLDIKKEMQTDRVDAKKAVDILIRKKLESLEVKKRKIDVTSAEVYADIKQMAARNNMSISEFYDAVRESNGLSSEQLKEKIKQKLLSQKLYSAIAMSSMSEPGEEEIKDYYELHKNDFKHPASFSVVIYDSKEKSLLKEKVDNPMFYSPQIASNEQELPYGRISPELASLLSKTKVGSFTPIVPNGKGGFMSFYVKSVTSAADVDMESLRPQIVNAIMSEKREAILSDYFARLRDNADINIIRMPEES